MKYIMIPAMFALSMCTPVHAMDNQDCKYTKTVNQSEGQIVSSTTDYDCKTTPTVIVKESEPTVIYRTGTTVSSPVTTTRVVSSTPVYHNNHSNQNISDIVSIVAKEIFFSGAASRTITTNDGFRVTIPNRKKGTCYATKDFIGTVCY